MSDEQFLDRKTDGISAKIMELAGLYEIPIILTGSQTQSLRKNLSENLIILHGIPRNDSQNSVTTMKVVKARPPGNIKLSFKSASDFLTSDLKKNNLE